MKYAFHLHPLRHHWAAAHPTETEQARLFRRISQAGFVGLDLSDSWPLEQLGQANAQRTRLLAQDAGLSIPTLNCMGKTLCHPELGASHCSAVLAALDSATWLGVEVVNLSLAIPRVPGKTPVMGVPSTPGGSRGATENDYALTALRLQEIACAAAERGLLISIELHDRGIADTSESILQILQRVEASNIGVTLDLSNGYRAYNQTEPWLSALKNLAPKTFVWHVNNMQKVSFSQMDQAVFLERNLMDGDIDYRLAMAHMQAAGFQGWVVPEYKGSGDAFEALTSGMHYMQRIEIEYQACEL